MNTASIFKLHSKISFTHAYSSKSSPATMANPFQPHPLYRYRRILLILSILSFALAVVASIDYGWIIWIVHIIFTCLSSLLCFFDLVRYALGQGPNPQAERRWPLKKVMWGDATMTILFLYMLSLELTGVVYYYERAYWSAYASVVSALYAYVHSNHGDAAYAN